MFVVLLLLIATGVEVNGSVNTVLPLHYEISLEPDFSGLTLKGQTAITVNVDTAVSTITLRGKNLEIEEIKISDGTSESICDNFNVDPSSETVTVLFNPRLEVGLYKISITHTGKINNKVQEGFYVTYYTNVNEITRQIGLTNFEIDKARQVFPCFDDPRLPATFSFTIIRPNDYYSVSSSPKISEVKINDQKMGDVFAQTDPIPTHLLAFAIIDFINIINEQHPVYSSAKLGIEMLISASETIAQELQSSYPHRLNKVNQIVVPDDAIPKKVVESAGLVLYRESAVVYDEGTGSSEKKQTIYKTIAHAFAKQWASLNSNAEMWWSNLWWNEGAITYYQYEVLARLQPSWRLLEQLVVEDLHHTLRNDVGTSEIAVAIDDELPSTDILENPIFYSKSFALIRMLTHAYDTPVDITDNSQGSITHSWTYGAGYPLVTILRDYAANSAIVLQGKFLPKSSTQMWTIPIDYATSSDPNFAGGKISHILTGKITSISLTVAPEDWLIVNKRQNGYYRVNYDDTNWKLITNYLQTELVETIDHINRAQLIDDAFNLAENGYISYRICLELIKYLNREVDYIPLNTFFKNAIHVKNLLSHSDTQEKFLNFTRNLFHDLYGQIGVNIKPFEPHTDRLNRVQALKWLCEVGYEACQEEMYAALSSAERFHPDIEDAVYCGGMRSGSIVEFLFLYTQYSQHGKRRALSSMGCTSNSESLREYILGIFLQSRIVKIDRRDRLDAFLAIIEGSDAGLDLSLDLIKQHTDQFFVDFSQVEVSAIFEALSKKIAAPEQGLKIDGIIACARDEVKNQYADVFEKAQSNIQTNLQWRTAYLSDIDTWLNENANPDISSTTTTTEMITTTTTEIITTLPTLPTTTKDPNGGAATHLLAIQTLMSVFFLLLLSNRFHIV